MSAATEICGGPSDIAAHATSSAIHAGNSRETPCPIRTSMTLVPFRPFCLTTGSRCPCNGCHRYAMITVSKRYAE